VFVLERPGVKASQAALRPRESMLGRKGAGSARRSTGGMLILVSRKMVGNLRRSQRIHLQ